MKVINLPSLLSAFNFGFWYPKKLAFSSINPELEVVPNSKKLNHARVHLF